MLYSIFRNCKAAAFHRRLRGPKIMTRIDKYSEIQFLDGHVHNQQFRAIDMWLAEHTLKPICADTI
jgi:hypothetical protein